MFLPGAHAVVVRLEAHLEGRPRFRHRHRVHRQRVRQVEHAEAARQRARPLPVRARAVMTVSMSSRVTLQFRSVTLAQAAVALSRAEVSSVCWIVE